MRDTADSPAPTAPEADAPPAISYAHVGRAQMQLIEQLGRLMGEGARRFCDIGGGANPIVSLRKIGQLGLDYLVLDSSEEELAKAPLGYRTRAADILDGGAAAELVAQEGPFDVVASRWTAEHMPDGGLFHRRVRELLAPGGAAVHLLPTLYSPVFVINRLLPPGASSLVLGSGSDGGRGEEGKHAKFRSYYSWCRGPTPRQLRRLRSAGYRVESYTGYFGHSYYRRIPPLDRAQAALTARLLEHPRPGLTSFALVVLRRSR